MTIEEMMKRKNELGYTYAQIAELSNVPIATVQKVLGGITKSPRHETLVALEKVLAPKTTEQYKSSEGAFTYSLNERTYTYVAESAAQYGKVKKQGEYTLEDYYALPDDIRAELIDGVFYYMSAPTSIHQLLAGAIYAEFRSYVRKQKGQCMPFIAPFDVQLDMDDRTMVQPDVIIVCDRKKIIRRGLFGAPDLVVEILSPSTRKKDITVKFQKYMDTGVREYWLVWPDQKKVMVWALDSELCPIIYGFDSQVPVGIWNGDCKIDFQDIFDEISFLYELKNGNE